MLFKCSYTIVFFLCLLSLSASVSAQIESSDGNGHSHHHMANMDMDMDSTMPMMSHSFSPNLPMNRNGSGTAWMPDATPIYAYMLLTPRNWDFMFHGSVFFGFNRQDIFNSGARGGQRFTAPNWFMGMAQKKLGTKDLFSFELMMSLDRLTEGGEGYPLTFQTGETWDGKKLVDHQHPHDLFSGLTFGYTHAFTKDIDLSAYIGYPGEPALGPVAFMHRLSSFNNPLAPISHHWQDATHITFGVGTLSFRWKWIKAEGSIFTGREPNENRWTFDRLRFDSYSYRISVNPHRELALQFSQGFIHSPEAAEPDDNLTRYTASIIHTHVFNRPEAHISSSLAWGLNIHHSRSSAHALLLESNFQWNRFALYGRYEWVQKDALELDLAQYFGNKLYNVQAATIGSNVRLFSILNTNLSFGVQFTFNIPKGEVAEVYGTLPIGTVVYLHITPALMK